MVDSVNTANIGLDAGIYLPVNLWEQMQADVQACSPREACGLVGGMERRALGVFRVVNALQSPVRYRMDAEGQVRVFLDLERRGWDLLAIYHSHPTGPNHPSPTDLSESAYPEAVHLIWSPQAGEWQCRAFLIQEENYFETPIRLVE